MKWNYIIFFFYVLEYLPLCFLFLFFLFLFHITITLPQQPSLCLPGSPTSEPSHTDTTQLSHAPVATPVTTMTSPPSPFSGRRSGLVIVLKSTKVRHRQIWDSLLFGPSDENHETGQIQAKGPSGEGQRPKWRRTKPPSGEGWRPKWRRMKA